MFKYIFVVLIAVLAGCGIKYGTQTSLVGTNLVTPYGAGNINAEHSANVELPQ